MDIHGQIPNKKETAAVNGINLYYEFYGQGEPLLLLHGWTQTSQFWKAYIPILAENYQVFAIDLRGHGRTSILSENFSIQKVSDDILGLMDDLKFEKVYAIGMSYGGLALLELANKFPKRIEKMILIGATNNFKGGEGQDENNKFLFENLPEEFKTQLRKSHHLGEAQIKALFDPNLNYEIRLSNDDLNAISASTLIINGDQDEILGIDHAIVLHKNLPVSNLWIVPNTGHVAISDSNKSEFLKIALEFFKIE